jgi:PadR family transcriptional regulator, regulatory protein PadR
VIEDETRWPPEWMRGALELCALAAVAQEPAHGYAVATRLSEHGIGPVKGGTLYPLLARLETQGLVTARWEVGDGGPGRKVLSITARGRQQLQLRAALWREFTATTVQLIDTAAPAGPVPAGSMTATATHDSPLRGH